MEPFYPHNAAIGTQHGREDDDALYWTGNADIPTLPSLTGFMGTHGVYRQFTVLEQTAVMIGEAKHGLWRIHESGFIREYLRSDHQSCWHATSTTNPNDNLTSSELDILKESYSHYHPEDSWSFYRYPDDEIDSNGCLNFVDLTIYHPKYEGVYDSHEPIDMPMMYCTMTQNDYPHVKQAWNYAKAQPLANQVGPLGHRAGLDITHLYLNVVRFELFPDASLWVNIGDEMKTTLEDLMADEQKVDYQRTDPDKMNMEFYLVERPFFNHPYLFIIGILENKEGDSEFSYIRPDGYYYDQLIAKGFTSSDFGTDHSVAFAPKVHVENYDTENNVTTYEEAVVRPIPVYAAQNRSRISFGLTGGACPTKGGDYSTYPFGNTGAGWPTNYEEVGPLCDGYLLDVKVWANLGTAESWTDRSYLLANSGLDGGNNMSVGYHVHANIYGRFVDSYLVDNGITNPQELDLNNGVTVNKDDYIKPTADFALNYTRFGYHAEIVNPSHEDMHVDYRLIQADKTLRPVVDPEMCASFKDRGSKPAQLYWADCEQVERATIVNEFEFNLAKNDDHYGYITTTGDGQKMCWTIKSTKRGVDKQTVLMSKCKNSSKQRWIMEDGQVWFYVKHHFKHEPIQKYCVPYQGERTNLRVRRCFRELQEYSNNGRFEEHH